MCGIFGLRISNKLIDEKDVESLIHDLFLLSESRGKEASGISLVFEKEIKVLKSPLPASDLIRRNEYHNLLASFFKSKNNESGKSSYFVMGHSRLVTNGGQQFHTNNQPVVSNDMVAVHNGIITNVDDLWLSNPSLEKRTQLDTEVFLSLFRNSIKTINSISQALSNTYEQIEGVASIAIQFADYDGFLLSTNNGSVYYLESEEPGIFIFASERYILQRIAEKHSICKKCQSIKQLQPGSAILDDYDQSNIYHWSYISSSDEKNPSWLTKPANPRIIVDVSEDSLQVNDQIKIPGEGPYILPSKFKDKYPEVSKRVEELKDVPGASFLKLCHLLGSMKKEYVIIADLKKTINLED